MSTHFREPAVEILNRWITQHCHDADPTEVVRAVLDSVQTRVGQDLLRNLPRTRAYHIRTGDLEPNELLTSGAVMALIRRTTGMEEAEPGQPIERDTRRGLRARINRGEQ